MKLISHFLNSSGRHGGRPSIVKNRPCCLFCGGSGSVPTFVPGVLHVALMYMIIISLLFVGSVSAAENGLFAIPPDWRYSGGTEAPVQAEVTDLVYDGAKAQALKLTCLPLKADVTVREPGIVRQLIKLNLSEHKVLSFKAKFIATGEAKPLFTIRLLGKGVNLQKVFSPKVAEPVECAD